LDAILQEIDVSIANFDVF